MSVLAGAGGLLLAAWLAQSLIPALDQGDEFAIDVALNSRAVLFTLLIALGQQRAVRSVPGSTRHRSEAGGVVAGCRDAAGSAVDEAFPLAAFWWPARSPFRCLLISAAGLLVQSVRNLERVELGFDPSNILLFRVDPTLNGYDGDRLRTLYTSILGRLRAVPGVTLGERLVAHVGRQLVVDLGGVCHRRRGM